MKRNRPIAISASIAVLVTTGLATHSWTAFIIVAVCLIVSAIFWFRLGAEISAMPSEIRKNHTYIYYSSSGGSQLDPENLMLGELRIKYKISGSGYYMEEAQPHDQKYRKGKFRIDVVTHPLIHGKEYLGEIIMRDEKPKTTLMLAKERDKKLLQKGEFN
jgi:hypothetical protein